MVFKNICLLVLWTKEASAFEGLKGLTKISTILTIHIIVCKYVIQVLGCVRLNSISPEGFHIVYAIFEVFPC